MSKCYVVYTDYQEDTMILNNLQHNVVIDKVFTSENKAIGYVKSELELQCDKIIHLDEEPITQNAEWVAVLKKGEDILFAEVYYNNDWQYTIYIKEMEVIQVLNLLIMWSLCGISHATLPKEKDNGNNKK